VAANGRNGNYLLGFWRKGRGGGCRAAALVLLLVLVACAWGAGCVKRETAPKDRALPEKVTVQVPVGPPSAPLFKLAEDGLPGGVKVELTVYRNVEEATARLVKGEADFTVLPLNTAAKLYNRDVGVRLVNVSTWGILYLLTTDPGVLGFADLKGKKLYVGARGSTPDVLTTYLLSKNGLSGGQVDIVYLESTEIAQLLINGLAENAVLPEPLATQALLKNERVRSVADFYQEWRKFEGENASLPQAGTVVSSGFAGTYPDAVAAFLDGYAGALDWTLSHPQEAARLVEANLKIPPAVFVKSIERTRLASVPASQAKADVLAYLSRLLEFSPDMVGGRLPDENFFWQR